MTGCREAADCAAQPREKSAPPDNPTNDIAATRGRSNPPPPATVPGIQPVAAAIRGKISGAAQALKERIISPMAKGGIPNEIPRLSAALAHNDPSAPPPLTVRSQIAKVRPKTVSSPPERAKPRRKITT